MFCTRSLFWLWIVTVLVSPQWCDAAAAQFDPIPVNIPEIGQEQPRPILLTDLVQIRDITGLALSPDGKNVAFVLSEARADSNSYRTGLFVCSTGPGAVPRSLGNAGPPTWNSIGQIVRQTPQWSPDSRQITYMMAVAATRQVWSWDSESGAQRQLTHQPGDVVSYEWSTKGDTILFETEVEPSSQGNSPPDGVRYDGTLHVWEGRPILELLRESQPKPRSTWIYETTTGVERPASSDDEAKFSRPSHAPEPQGIGSRTSFNNRYRAYIYQFTKPEESSYYAFAAFLEDLRSGHRTRLTPISPTSIPVRLWWTRDDRELLIEQSIDGNENLYSISIENITIRQVSRSDDNLSDFSFDREYSMAACIRQNSTKPPEIGILALKDGQARTLVNVNPEFGNIELSSPTKLEWLNKFGDRAFGYLVRPLNYVAGRRYPLVVTTYRAGTEFLRGAVGDEYPIQSLAASGFAVLVFDAPPRPTTGVGDFSRQLMDWASPLSSLEKAVDTLDDMGVIDRNRVGISGLSYGAEITEFAITHSGLFAAAADSGGGGRDPLFYFISDDSWHKEFAEWGLGPPEGESAPLWRQLSPALNASKVSAPLLIQAAESEYLAALQFYNALKDDGKAVELFVYPGERHVKNQPIHRLHVYERNLDWFKFWLQDVVDQDPARKDQYDRWRKLRDLRDQKATAPIVVP
jgi:dipeptidyl aminopeptidase/acylaminoacyl peptidase